MKNELDAMKYFTAAEKVEGLLFSLKILLEYVDEFQIVADEEVKKVLIPELDKIKDWLK